MKTMFELESFLKGKTFRIVFDYQAQTNKFHVDVIQEASGRIVGDGQGKYLSDALDNALLDMRQRPTEFDEDATTPVTGLQGFSGQQVSPLTCSACQGTGHRHGWACGTCGGKGNLP